MTDRLSSREWRPWDSRNLEVFRRLDCVVTENCAEVTDVKKNQGSHLTLLSVTGKTLLITEGSFSFPTKTFRCFTLAVVRKPE